MTSEQKAQQRQALTDLLQSDGWRLFSEQMGTAWGAEAFEQRVDQELEKRQPGDDELAVVMRIRDTFKGVRASLDWPKTRLRELAEPAAGGTFDKFRRIAR